MNTNNIRTSFLNFFKNKKHIEYPSSSLVPENDKSLLFTNAGMVQFKDILLGKKSSKHSRIVSCQKCMRAGGKHNDLENIGKNSRHHTFFEMLGNFSFGDYFKKESINYAWEFLTNNLKLNPDKLYITVYNKDIESKNIWLKNIGIKKSNIQEKGEKDNFWSMDSTGPCGPCSEIFYDKGIHIKNIDDRFVEVWNLVFMQFNRSHDGKLSSLSFPSIDTGMGLERISCILENKESNYHTSIFVSLFHELKNIIKNQSIKQDSSVNVIIDHIRACSFLISDGILPNNEGRGYVVRRIIRRAMLQGHKLGIENTFFHKLVPILSREMQTFYPELKRNIEQTINIIKDEEEKFFFNLKRGIKLIKKEFILSKNNTLSGKKIFSLYDTYGFPIDLTINIAQENGFKCDIDSFNHIMGKNKDLSKSKYKETKKKHYYIDNHLKTEFIGYTNIKSNSKVIGIYNIDEKINST